MTGIHQILAAAAAGDAITNAALEIRSLLRSVGPSEVYARHIAPEMEGEVRRLGEYPSRTTGDALIYHASIGEPLVHAFLISRREPLVLVYHNVTPARYFESWDPTFAELLNLGRSELVDLRHRVTAAIADSTYNAVELEALGYKDVTVVPPVIDPYRLARVAPTPSVLHHLDTMMSNGFFLYVGQLLPHKRVDLLVQAMQIAVTYDGLDVNLLLVGHPRLRSYAAAVCEMVRELNLPNVHVVGSVSNADLAAYYTRTLGVVTASEHEGFCVPLVEAMAFGRPIIARSCGAVPETLGDGGLLLPPDGGPALFAQAIRVVAVDDAVSEDLAARSRRRATELDENRAHRDLIRVLAEVL